MPKVKKVIIRISIILLFSAFIAEKAVPLFNNITFVAIAETDESDEQKEEDQNEAKDSVKDKILYTEKAISIVADCLNHVAANFIFRHTSYLSVPDMPPDIV